MMKSTFLPLLLAASALGSTKYDLPVAYSAVGEIRSQTIPLNRLAGDRSYSVLFSLPAPAHFGPDARLTVEVLDHGRILIAKTLHTGDTDLFGSFYVPPAAHPELRLSATEAKGSYRLQINKLPASPNLKRGGNHTWQDASPMTLGQTVFASGDEAEYFPVPGTTRKEYATDPHGQDWYRFNFDSDVPKLVYFQLELTDRDDLPVDVSIFRVQNGALVEYTRGQDPVAVPHEVQALPGNKFAPRILQEKGEYFARSPRQSPGIQIANTAVRRSTLFRPARSGSSGGRLHHGRRRLLVRQYTQARRHPQPHRARSSGDIPLRRLSRQPFFSARPALFHRQRLSRGAKATTAISRRALL